MLMIFAWVYSSSPSWPSAVPRPDCLAPQNGTSGGRSRCLLIQTVPGSIRSATSYARSMSADQSSLARATILVDAHRFGLLDVLGNGFADLTGSALVPQSQRPAQLERHRAASQTSNERSSQEAQMIQSG
jgi:hypothetical protein